MTEETQVMNQPPTPPNNNEGSSVGGPNRMLILGGLGALVLLILVVIAAVLLIPRLFGAGAGAIASVLPPDTSVLVEVNARNLNNENTTRIANAFEDVFDEADVEFDADEPQSLLETFDEELEDEIGLTISDDVLPWIGFELGIGIIDLDVEAMDEGEVPQWIFASTIRDEAVADEFIEDLIDAIEDETGNDVDDDEYNGVLLFEVDSDLEEEQIAFGRSDNIFFLAANMDTLEEAIDAQNGENLGDSEAYQNLIAELPGDRALTFYMDGETLQDTFATAQEEAALEGVEGIDSDLLDEYDFTAVGLAVTAIEQGIQLDAVTLYESLTEEQQALLDAQSDDIQTAEFLPESTYMFLVGHRLDVTWETIKDSMDAAGMPQDDLDEAMDMFDDTFGFNPDDDLFPILDGEYSIALIDSNDGLIAEEFGADLGAIIMLGSSNGEELAEISEDLTDGLEDQGLDVDDSGDDTVTIYEVEENGEPIGAYGVSEEYIILSTSADDIENLFADEASLADSEAFQNAWNAFPRGTVPVMYLDVASLLAELEDLDPEVEETADMNPVTAFAMGTNADDNATRSTMILFIGE